MQQPGPRQNVFVQAEGSYQIHAQMHQTLRPCFFLSCKDLHIRTLRKLQRQCRIYATARWPKPAWPVVPVEVVPVVCSCVERRFLKVYVWFIDL